MIVSENASEVIISYKGDILTGPAKVKGYDKLTAEQKKCSENF